MATHSSVLAWRIPWIEEPGWLLSMGASRQGYWSGLTCLKQLSMHMWNLKSKANGLIPETETDSQTEETCGCRRRDG